MHRPAVAVGLWKAAWVPVVTGGVGGLVWQSVQDSCGDFRGFSGFDAWWHISHLAATLTCEVWSNFTPPIGAPFIMTGALGACACWAAAPVMMTTTKHPSKTAISLLTLTTPPGIGDFTLR